MHDRESRAADLRHFLSPENASVLYIYVVGFVIFSLWIPNLWLSFETQRSILTSRFDPGLGRCRAGAVAARRRRRPLDRGVMGAAAITSSWLVVDKGWSLPLALAAALGVALIAGFANGVVVVKVGMNSFIATLGTGAVLGAYAEWRSGGVQITGLPDSFKNLARGEILWGVQAKVMYLIVAALVIWYVIEHTPIGRYLQATGDNADAARLAGVQTSRYAFGALIAGAFIAGVAGIVQTASISAGNANVGDPFLLTAFAAAFLGSTQFRGRFNVWGTVLAVWTLLSLVKGVELALQSYRWLNEFFFGSALIAAVGMSKIFERRAARRAAAQRQRDASAAEAALAQAT